MKVTSQQIQQDERLAARDAERMAKYAKLSPEQIENLGVFVLVFGVVLGAAAGTICTGLVWWLNA